MTTMKDLCRSSYGREPKQHNFLVVTASTRDHAPDEPFLMCSKCGEQRPIEKLPQPQRNDGGAPCGECHIQPGETCDICGAVNGS